MSFTEGDERREQFLWVRDQVWLLYHDSILLVDWISQKPSDKLLRAGEFISNLKKRTDYLWENEIESLEQLQDHEDTNWVYSQLQHAQIAISRIVEKEMKNCNSRVAVIEKDAVELCTHLERAWQGYFK